MALFNIFARKVSFEIEHAKVVQLRDLHKSNKSIVDYQKARSLLVYYESVYDCYLRDQIKLTSNSLGNYKYQYTQLSPLYLMNVDEDIKEKAEKNLKGRISKKVLSMPGMLDLDNEIHFVFAMRVFGRFERVMREHGLDSYSIENSDIAEVKELRSNDLIDYKGIIYNAISYIKEYQISYRRNLDFPINKDYCHEMLKILDRFN